MQGRKEGNRQTYLVKKFNSKKENENRAKIIEEGEFACFKDMSAQALDLFMENKYDSYSAKNSENILKLNQSIVDRLAKLRQEFLNQQKTQFINFIQKAGAKTVTNENYEALINNTGSYCPKNSRLTRTSFNGLELTQVVINENTNDSETKIFYLSKLPECCTKDFDYKRLKKDVNEFLKEFIHITRSLKELRSNY